MKIKLKKKRVSIPLPFTQLGYFLIICAAVMRAMQFHVQTGDNMDLLRHFSMMKLIKYSGYSLYEYVFLYGDAFTSNISMRFCYAFNFVVYLAAKYLKNYYHLAWAFVFFDYLIISYIGFDWWKNQGGRKGIMFLYEILICFSLLPFFQTVSGLRTAMAACIMGLSIYLYLCKNKSLWTFLFVMAIGTMFHPAFITAAPFVVLAKKMDRKKALMIVFIASASVALIANLLIRSSNRFLYSIAFKYLQYTGEDGYRSTRFCYYGVIVICILTLTNYFYALFWKKKHTQTALITFDGKNDGAFMTVYDFIAYYMIYILSNIGKYEMVLRPAYLLGAMAPMVTGMVFNVRGKNRKRDVITNAILLMLLVIVSYVSFMYLQWHSEYFA
ncbi:MAG: EpsG family protein [Oscillospiraceae bacterium]|nr:EpsG family protein [Oscillospiraceae bacterium]